MIDTGGAQTRELFARLDSGWHASGAWTASFGTPTPELGAAYRTWLLGHQPPWQIVSGQWQERGELLEGRSQGDGLVVLKATPQGLSAELQPVGVPVGASLLFGFQSDDDFHMVQLRANRDVWVLHYLHGNWQLVASDRAATPVGNDTLALTRAGDVVTLGVNGSSIGNFVAPGQVGLNVAAGTLRFRVSVTP